MSSRLGFDYCGIAKAQRLDDDALRLEQWLNKGMHGTMKYMENHFELRVDPRRLVPGARSVITLLKNYYPAKQQKEGSLKISKYAYGKDYHEVIKGMTKLFLQSIHEEIGEVQGRGFVDSAPVLERSWAQHSGLGWIGKNGNLLTKQNGSFFFIATLITDLELQYDDPFAKDLCGTCRKCIDACPTAAIGEDKVVNGSQCISYFTIELKDMLIPGEMKGKFDNWAFGCDSCQDICPWNRFSKPSDEKEFTPIPEVLNLTSREWESMSEETFKKLFRHSAISRAKWKGMQRNVKFIKKDEIL
ncbi:MAG: tRNA epoxyqueuosine(34) reductase QueG [Bacteroidota bacterium]|nr:tRNA epoxyqueuosine(34) reductase QueG [Bacteroidota bacterium]